MTISTPSSLEDEALEEIAAAHSALLTGSSLSALGPAIIERYYVYVLDSPYETLFVASENGQLLGICVVSVRPDDLMQRFFRSSPLKILLTIAAKMFFDRPVRQFVASQLASAMSSGSGAALSCPELVQIFVPAAAQGKGIGKAIVSAVEENLIEKGFTRYVLKTNRALENPALRFYDRLGFSPIGEKPLNDGKYLYFEKHLSD